MWKYEEDRILDEMREYLEKTYKSHYAGSDGVQSMDLIASSGHAEGFCIGNIIKYSSRYGKKNGKNRDDLVKVLHYAMFALWEHDKKTGEAADGDKRLDRRNEEEEAVRGDPDVRGTVRGNVHPVAMRPSGRVPEAGDHSQELLPF